jgi:RHO1 GDP-GTP exchange protein 1/2
MLRSIASRLIPPPSSRSNLSYVDSPYIRDERISTGAPSPTATIAEGFGAAAQRRLSARTSSESVRSMPQVGPPGTRSSFGSGDMRAGSFSGSGGARDDAVLAVRSGSVSRSRSFARPMMSALPSSTHSFPTPSGSGTSLALQSNRPSGMPRAPTIYPALLSRVAEVFRQLIPLGDRVKDGLTYKDSFDGRDAVELIAEIIRTSDRNLALLLGRSLDAQRFFHDVTYDHRLRDSSVEIYRFRERLPSPFVPGEDGRDVNATLSERPTGRPANKGHSSGSLSMTAPSTHSNANSAAPTPATSTTTVNLTSEVGGRSRRDSASSTEDALPVGVFTLLTDCYSPTCSVNSLCYSINCPRRLEQQKRNNMKIQPGLTRKLSEESLVEVKVSSSASYHATFIC